MKNSSEDGAIDDWVRAIGTTNEQALIEQISVSGNANDIHINEIRLIKSLVQRRQLNTDVLDLPTAESTVLVSEEEWQKFLTSWQNESQLDEADALKSARSIIKVAEQKIEQRWFAVNQRWFALVAGICVVAVGLQMTYSLRQSTEQEADGVVMRGDEQAQRIIVSNLSEAKLKADEVESLLVNSGVLVRRISIDRGVQLQAKLSADLMLKSPNLKLQLERNKIDVPEHGRLTVEWVISS